MSPGPLSESIEVRPAVSQGRVRPYNVSTCEVLLPRGFRVQLIMAQTDLFRPA